MMRVDSASSISSLPSLPTFNHNLTPSSSIAGHGQSGYYQSHDDDMEVIESDDEDRIVPSFSASSTSNHHYSSSGAAKTQRPNSQRRTDSYILTSAPSSGSPGSYTFHSTAEDSSAEAGHSTDAIHASLVLARHLFSVAVTEKWCRQENFSNAVAVRVSVGSYILYPQEGSSMPAFSRAMLELNCDAAIIINTPLVAAALLTLNPGENEIRLSSSKRVQVVKSLDYLGGARRA